MKKIVLILGLTLALTSLAAAQYGYSSDTPKFEFFGHVGSQTESMAGSTNTELGYGAGLGYFLTENIQLEFDFDYASGFDRAMPYSVDGSTVIGVNKHKNYFTMFNFLYYFGDTGGVRPYMLAGVGNVHRAHEDFLPVDGGAGLARFNRAENEFGATFGSGIRIPLNDWAGLRLEYRISSVGGDAVHRFRAGLSMVF